jgi:hypothetical protein
MQATVFQLEEVKFEKMGIRNKITRRAGAGDAAISLED